MKLKLTILKSFKLFKGKFQFHSTLVLFAVLSIIPASNNNVHTKLIAWGKSDLKGFKQTPTLAKRTWKINTKMISQDNP